jgi:hypothetical protein
MTAFRLYRFRRIERPPERELSAGAIDFVPVAEAYEAMCSNG